MLATSNAARGLRAGRWLALLFVLDSGARACLADDGATIPTLARATSRWQLHSEPRARSWRLSVINGGQPRATRPASSAATAHEFSADWPAAPAGARSGQTRSLDEGAAADAHVAFAGFGGTLVSGDFNGDGATDLGAFVEGEWFLDLNGNRRWDRGDLRVRLGGRGDQPVTGDWDGDGKTDIGVFGPSDDAQRRAEFAEAGLPDASNRLHGLTKNLPSSDAQAARRTLWRTAEGAPRTDAVEHTFAFGAAGDVAVVGDWNGDGIDSIGVFRDGHWLLDLDGDGVFTVADRRVEFGVCGDRPVVGDWNGDGIDDVGVFQAGQWLLDSDANARLGDADRRLSLGSAGDVPLVGDFAATGRDQLAVVHRNRQSANAGR